MPLLIELLCWIFVGNTRNIIAIRNSMLNRIALQSVNVVLSTISLYYYVKHRLACIVMQQYYAIAAIATVRSTAAPRTVFLDGKKCRF